MKLKPRQYAQALYELAVDSTGKELKQTVVDFVSLLVKRGDIKQQTGIIESFSTIYDRHQGIAEVKISSSFKLTEAIKEKIKKQLKQLALFKDYKHFNLIEKNQPDLIGGIRLEYKDVVIDASLNGKIDRLKEEMINH